MSRVSEISGLPSHRITAGYVSHQITSYSADDGQQISDLAWSPDAQSIFFVRGGSSDNPEQVAPNPAHLPEGAEQDIWVVSVNGGAPRKVGKGHAPSVSPDGNLVAWFADGQIWYEKPGDIGVKPPQSIHVFGDCKSFVWSPDGRGLAFVSDRGSHSFIGIFSPSTNSGELSRSRRRSRQLPSVVAGQQQHRLHPGAIRQRRELRPIATERTALVHPHCECEYRQGA